MNKKTIIIFVVIAILVIGGIIVLVTNQNNKSKNNIDDKTNNGSQQKVVTDMYVIINDKGYNIKLENNETAQAFAKIAPVEYDMNELNGNEKYAYLTKSLPTNASNPGNIEAGDIMLFGDNCLVIFYESFATSYTYTKIGHVENLPNLGNKTIKAHFTLVD